MQDHHLPTFRGRNTLLCYVCCFIVCLCVCVLFNFCCVLCPTFYSMGVESIQEPRFDWGGAEKNDRAPAAHTHEAKRIYIHPLLDPTYWEGTHTDSKTSKVGFD